MSNQGSNKSRGCVKSVGVKFGNDQIFDMKNFDEVSRRIEWSKNEFSHSLSPAANAGWRLQFRFAVHGFSSRVAELWRLATYAF